MENKIIISKLLSFIFILSVLTGCGLQTGAKRFEEEIKKSEQHFEKFNYSFIGSITYKKSFSPNRGFAGLKLTYTEIDYYDIRDSTSYYFCVIRNDSAEVYFNNGWGRMNIGDVILFDGKVDSVYLYHFSTDSLKYVWAASIRADFDERVEYADEHEIN